MACRTAEAIGAAAVLCLAFPLQPPARAGKEPSPSRQPELDAVAVPMLVVQGERDRFGMPAPGPNREVVQVEGDHSLRRDREAIVAASRGVASPSSRRAVATPSSKAACWSQSGSDRTWMPKPSPSENRIEATASGSAWSRITPSRSLVRSQPARRSRHWRYSSASSARISSEWRDALSIS